MTTTTSKMVFLVSVTVSPNAFLTLPLELSKTRACYSLLWNIWVSLMSSKWSLTLLPWHIRNPHDALLWHLSHAVNSLVTGFSVYSYLLSHWLLSRAQLNFLSLHKGIPDIPWLNFILPFLISCSTLYLSRTNSQVGVSLLLIGYLLMSGDSFDGHDLGGSGERKTFGN